MIQEHHDATMACLQTSRFFRRSMVAALLKTRFKTIICVFLSCAAFISALANQPTHVSAEVEHAVENLFQQFADACNKRDLNRLKEIATKNVAEEMSEDWDGDAGDSRMTIDIESVSVVSQRQWSVVAKVEVDKETGRLVFDLTQGADEIIMVSGISVYLPGKEAGKARMKAVLSAIESRDEATVRKLISGDWAAGDGPEFDKWLKAMMAVPQKHFRASLTSISSGGEYPAYRVRLYGSEKETSFSFVFLDGQLQFDHHKMSVYDLSHEIVQPGFWQAVYRGDSVVEGEYLGQGSQYRIRLVVAGDGEAGVVAVDSRPSYRLDDGGLSLMTIAKRSKGINALSRSVYTGLLSDDEKRTVARCVRAISGKKGVDSDVINDLLALLIDERTAKIGETGLLFALSFQGLDLGEQAELALHNALLNPQVRFQRRVAIARALAVSKSKTARRMADALMNDRLMRDVILHHLRDAAPELFRETVASMLVAQPSLRAAGIFTVSRQFLDEKELVDAALKAYDIHRHDAGMLVPFMALYPRETDAVVHSLLTQSEAARRYRFLMAIEQENRVRLTEENLQAVRAIMNNEALPGSDRSPFRHFARIAAGFVLEKAGEQDLDWEDVIVDVSASKVSKEALDFWNRQRGAEHKAWASVLRELGSGTSRRRPKTATPVPVP